MRPRRILSAAGFALLLAVPFWADAAALGVTPVGFELFSGQKTAVLTLRNDADSAAPVQVRVFKWSQTGGEDQLDPTDAVVVSPPLTMLDPHVEQIVRIVRVRPAPTSEEDYRILVDQLPPPAGAAAGAEVRLLARHSIPLFFEPAASGAPSLSFQLAASDGGAVLLAQNRGARRVRLADLELLDDRGARVIKKSGLVAYVLPGSTVRWPLPPKAPVSGRVVVSTDLGPYSATLSAPPS